MRWHALFTDLENQLAAAEHDELAAEVADRTRREHARLSMRDRIGTAVGSSLVVQVAGAGLLRGTLIDVGPDWALVTEEHGSDAVVALPAVTSVSGLSRASESPERHDSVLRRLDLRHALRGVARSRSPVTVIGRDGSRATGTIDRVGADFIELAEHALGEARRARSIEAERLVPFGYLAVVRSS